MTRTPPTPPTRPVPPGAAHHVPGPTYDRAALARSVVHIGVGGFHRAHLASYLDELAAVGDLGWGIVGAGVLASDAHLHEVLRTQDGLYTLIVRGDGPPQVRVIGSLVEHLLAHPDPEPLIAAVADPATRIVSLTVTEGGYPVDLDTGEFDPSSPNAADGSAFAALVLGLERRHAAGLGPVTVLSCDNVIGNGEVARAATLGVAARIAPELCGWLEDEVAFPSSMVDRITPATTDADRAWLRDEVGIDDGWPVVTEPFRQWVVEDRFAAGRPPLEPFGVILTRDVVPYERLKLRLLNAGHWVLAYLARAAGHTRVDEVMAEARFAAYLSRFLADEAAPVLPPAPGIDTGAYIATLEERFANPAIGDQVDRLCLDSSAKLPRFVLPTVRAQLAAGGPVAAGALAVAGWCHYLAGRQDDGTPIELAADPLLAEAQRAAVVSERDPAAFLGLRAVFGDDLPRDERFADAVTDGLVALRRDGVRATIDQLLAGGSGSAPVG